LYLYKEYATMDARENSEAVQKERRTVMKEKGRK
jgi:hypothetical protein